jgi:hypothetical protein
MSENEQIQDIIAHDIYRQYAMTLIAINDFVHDKYSEKYTLENAQKQIDLLAGVANMFILEKIKKEDKPVIDKLIEKQKHFVNIDFKKIDVAATKIEAREIIDEYYRLFLKTRIFNIST